MSSEVAISTGNLKVGDVIIHANCDARYEVVGITHGISLRRIPTDFSFWRWLNHPINTFRDFRNRHNFTFTDYDCLTVLPKVEGKMRG